MGVEITAVVTVIPKLEEEGILPLEYPLVLKLASSNLAPDGQEKPMIQGEAILKERNEREHKYEAKIEVPEDFGEIGAVVVEVDKKSSEKYIRNLSLHHSPSCSFAFSCNSWVQPKNRIPHPRIFFSTQSYLPANTPAGLVKLRKEELSNLRGEINGEEDMQKRKPFERIYNYDVYNDLGNPDKDLALKRPVLGGVTHPYPRRCRSGRPPCLHDPISEERSKESFYFPRDEAFSEKKQKLFPDADPSGGDQPPSEEKKPFLDFTEIDLLFRDGIELPFSAAKQPGLDFSNTSTVRFPPPEAINRDKFNWLSDIEFARQTLAGLNPYSIQLVKTLPLTSQLDPQEYGPSASALTPELISRLIGTSHMTAQQAIQQKKLFVLDYHDTLLPYVTLVRGIKGTTLYGSRTLFFLNPDDTLRPLAIELTRPPMDGKPQWKQVFAPNMHATDTWLWRMAKAHVLAHDSCYHQLIVHWLRTHCAVEPYVIATNRQLSEMHPIYRLLHPHFRFTLRINSNAREILVNAGGIIENTFSTARYSMEISSMVYAKEWRFDLQSLPDDLIHRGMAKKDDHQLYGLKLTIEDYPFANDGLILWDALKEWITGYVNHYYPEGNPSPVENDEELQAWWKEIKEKGHGDKKEGWPNLTTPKDLIKVITTIAWVACGHHSAVNFGQYAHAAYFPSRPSIARINMPTEDSQSGQLLEDFVNKPENVLLKSFPSKAQAVVVAKTMFLLSTHSSDEEYVGKKMEPSWAQNPVISAAFKKFQEKMEELEKTIDKNNGNAKLKNRRGAGHVPYELLKPTSKDGVTGRGVPYSIST